MLACCIDRDYAELAAVMLRSAHLNGNIPDVEFCVLGDGLRPSDKEKIQRSVGRPVTFIDIDDEMLGRIKNLRTTSGWSRATYARLLLPDQMGAAYPRIVYLDADTLILGDISYLFTLPLGDHLVAGVAARGSKSPAELNRALGRSDDAFYFNAGVLVIDATKWRSEKASETCFALLHSRQFPFLDQDVLNLLASGRALQLGWQWNAQMADDYTDAVVVHFTHAKPNSLECRHPQQSAYLAVRATTTWADAPLRTKRQRQWKRYRHSIRKRWLAVLRRLSPRRAMP
ncbi:lipopolysaccharide biosynthesis glycosyltransferase [Rhizobium sp. PP-F2F-G36]|nr:lipopolysaccharide biosynthesis glycosyltransferase [Rhizobium sp. PP-F2F-G36]